MTSLPEFKQSIPGVCISAVVVLLIAFYLSIPLAASPEVYRSVKITWDPNPESDVIGYRVHYGSESGAYTQVVDVGSATAFEITGLIVEKRYFCSVTAYNSYGMDSDLATELVIPAIVPTMPSAAGKSTASNDANPNAINGKGNSPMALEIVVQQGKGFYLKGNKSKRNFGLIEVGKLSKAMVFNIKNHGTTRLTKLKVSFKGPQANYFKIVKQPTKSVAPGKRARFKVIYMPGKVKGCTVTMRIRSNDKDENLFRVKLTGRGTK